MKRSSATVILGIAAVAMAACQKTAPVTRTAPTPRTASASASAPAPNAPLYKRLGGYDAIAAVTDDFLSRLLGDPKMAPYFENVDAKGKQRIRQMIVDQLCAATGGPCVYVGASMPTAHKDLKISETAFGVAAQYLVASLSKFNVPQKEKDELMAIVASTKNDIVNK